MTDFLCPTRLYWDGAQGFARHDGVHVVRRKPPLAYTEVDYGPSGVGICRDRPCDVKRDMDHDERLIAHDLLNRVAIGARGQLL